MNLTGKSVLVTGGTSGLGLAIAMELVSKGAIVYVMGRTLKRSYPGGANYRFVHCDFSDLLNIKNALDELIDNGTRFDIIINNAGIFTPPVYSETVNGFERSFQINLFSHLLIDEIILRKSAFDQKPLFLVISSPVYKKYIPDFTFPSKENFKFFRVYAGTKYYMLLLGNFLRKEFPGTNFNFIGFDPGVFSSGIYRSQARWFHYVYRLGAIFMRSPEKVATTVCRVIESEKADFNSVFDWRGGVSLFEVAENEKSNDFLKSCYAALQVVPRLY